MQPGGAKTPSKRIAIFDGEVRPGQPLRIAVICAVFGGLIACFGFISASMNGDEVSGQILSFTIFVIALALVFGGLAFGVSYAFQLVGWIKTLRAVRMGICNRCFKMTLDGTLDACLCGGTFEDADCWTLNRCPKCDYDLRGANGLCIECGTDAGKTT